MSTVYTRRADDLDVFAMEEILRKAFKESHATFMPEQHVREWYDNNEAQGTVRKGLGRAAVADIMGRIVGFVMYLDNNITQLWVDPEFQRQGVGRALIEWVEAEYRTKGYPTITMYCYEGNEALFEFCKKMRFRKASTLQDRDIQGGPVTAYNMLKMVTKLKRK